MGNGRCVIVGVAAVAAEVAVAQLPPGYEDAGGRERIVMATLGVLQVVPPPAVSLANAREWLQFAPGQASAEVTGELDVGAAREFHVVLHRGQTMSVGIDADGAPARFSVLRKGRPLFEGRASAHHEWSGLLPATDDYVVRIAAADEAPFHGERTRFQLRVAVVGQR